MSIAEKLTTIAENTPKVYNAGYEKGKAEGGDILDYSTNVEIANQYINKDIVELVYGSKIVSGDVTIPSFYSTSGMRHLKIDFIGECTNKTASYDSKLRFNTTSHEDTLEILELPIIEKLLPNTLNRAFQYRRKLKEIRATIDATHCTSFGNNGLNCPLLEEIRFKPNTIFVNPLLDNCPLLSNESIESTVNGLADLTGQKSQTVTFHADVKAKLTDEQITTITSKNWTLA